MKKGGSKLCRLLSEKGTALLAKFKKFQKLSLVLYALAAMAFVFAGNILLTIIIVALDYLPGNKVV